MPRTHRRSVAASTTNDTHSGGPMSTTDRPHATDGWVR